MKRSTTKTSATAKSVAMGSFTAMNGRNFGSC